MPETCSLILQVTEGKTKIEKALKLNRKLRKESYAVQDFINRSNHELDIREQATPGLGIEKDLSFAKVLVKKIGLCEWYNSLRDFRLCENNCAELLPLW